MAYTFLNDKITALSAVPSCRRRNPEARSQKPEWWRHSSDSIL